MRGVRSDHAYRQARRARRRLGPCIKHGHLPTAFGQGARSACTCNTRTDDGDCARLRWWCILRKSARPLLICTKYLSKLGPCVVRAHTEREHQSVVWGVLQSKAQAMNAWQQPPTLFGQLVSQWQKFCMRCGQSKQSLGHQRLGGVRHHMQVRWTLGVGGPLVPHTKKSQLIKAGLGQAPTDVAVPGVPFRRMHHAV